MYKSCVKKFKILDAGNFKKCLTFCLTCGIIIKSVRDKHKNSNKNADVAQVVAQRLGKA